MSNDDGWRLTGDDVASFLLLFWYSRALRLFPRWNHYVSNLRVAHISRRGICVSVAQVTILFDRSKYLLSTLEISK